MDSSDFTLRRATPDDAATIADQRVRMFAETRPVTEAIEASLRETLPDILRDMLESGLYAGWLVEKDQGSIVAGAGVQIRQLLPRVDTQVPCEAIVVNVYVAPDCRSQGLARRLMETILGWVHEQAIERVVLHPSVMGNPLYESLGFVPTNELVFYVKADRAAE